MTEFTEHWTPILVNDIQAHRARPAVDKKYKAESAIIHACTNSLPIQSCCCDFNTYRKFQLPLVQNTKMMGGKQQKSSLKTIEIKESSCVEYIKGPESKSIKSTANFDQC